MTLSVIAAVAENGVIGRNNTLPWRLPEDLRRFKSITMGHPLIMGRKTWESLGRPLPGRTNIVVTGNKRFRPDGAVVAPDFEAALARAREADGAEEIFVIGGESLFQEALARADRLYLTLIHRAFEGDARFPETDWRGAFGIVEEIKGFSEQSGLPYSFIRAERPGETAQ